MNNRFKFRVWNKARQCFIPEKEIFICGNGELVLIDEALNRTWVKDNPNYEVSLCTGLHDKNGKLIYEGDIVTYDWLTPISKVWRTDGKHIVEWQDGFTVIGNIAGYDVEHGKTRNVEVIGNRYENKELLDE